MLLGHTTIRRHHGHGHQDPALVAGDRLQTRLGNRADRLGLGSARRFAERLGAGGEVVTERPGRRVQDALHILIDVFVINGGQVDRALSGRFDHLTADLFGIAGLKVPVAEPAVETHQRGEYRQTGGEHTA